MDMKKFYDIVTTLIFGLVPLTLLVISYTLIYIPPEYIVLVTMITGIISQYASNQRVKDSVETVKKWIRFDYLTTILLAIWPILVAYQPQIMLQIPGQLIIPVTIIFTIISQWVAEKREINGEPITVGITD